MGARASMILGFIVVCFFLGMLYSFIKHIHSHQVYQDDLLEWLVTRNGGDPELVHKNAHVTHYNSEIGGPNNGY